MEYYIGEFSICDQVAVRFNCYPCTMLSIVYVAVSTESFGHWKYVYYKSQTEI